MADMFNIPQADLIKLSSNILKGNYPKSNQDQRDIGYLLMRHTYNGYLPTNDLNNVYGINLLDILNRYNNTGR